MQIYSYRHRSIDCTQLNRIGWEGETVITDELTATLPLLVVDLCRLCGRGSILTFSTIS